MHRHSLSRAGWQQGAKPIARWHHTHTQQGRGQRSQHPLQSVTPPPPQPSMAAQLAATPLGGTRTHRVQQQSRAGRHAGRQQVRTVW